MASRIIQTACLAAAAMVCLSTPYHQSTAAEGQPRRPITIVVGRSAPSVETLAAGDLAAFLQKLYPDEVFEVGSKIPDSGRCILLGSPKSLPELNRYVSQAHIAEPESFAVAVQHEPSRDVAVIAGADPRGCAYGVYAVLERLGCGFYLSYDALPQPRRQSFSFDGWQFTDKPLAADRIVFEWHNFMTGCTGWNFADWKKWIEQLHKMRFNTIMVHAYGTNPMFTFQFGGCDKPVTHVSSTARGRDWSNEHINDVRRLVGGSAFTDPVYGTDVALAPEDRQTAAAQDLMKRVFATAADRGMHVCFALDVDTISSNPQKLIMTLPERARFKTGKFWLANPDTPEGYSYYKAQAESLFKLYPQIDRLAIWVRLCRTPWTTLVPDELPASWQAELQTLMAKDPTLAQQSTEATSIRTQVPSAASWFALSKVVAAYQRTLRELDRKDVRLMVGGWLFDWMPTADRCLPRTVTFVPLDYAVLEGRSELDTPDRRQATRKLAERRSIVPIVWAQHDDGAFRGRSEKPYDDFQTKLARSGLNSFGIIHWATRPLDLYFKNLSEQVWSDTANQDLRATCEKMADRSFGPTACKTGAEYLSAWLAESPTFSRETGDLFMDRPVTPKMAEQVADGCRRRLTMLDRIDPAPLDNAARERLAYYRDIEEFVAEFYRAECLYQQGCNAVAKGDFDSLRQAVAECRPEAIVQRYANACRRGGGNAGETAGIFSINLRWLPYQISLRQAFALEPVRLKFGPTLHNPLAERPGGLTFFADAQRHLWRVCGARELGVEAFVWPNDTKPEGSANRAELCQSGIESAQPVTLELAPFLHDMRKSPRSLRPGKYRVRLLAADPRSTASGQRVFTVRLTTTDANNQKTSTIAEKTVDLFKIAGAAGRIAEVVMEFEHKRGEQPKLTLIPIHGKALLCAATVEPE
ncbi:MAG: hypothetical protein ABFC77_10705 [Thermoguttaceae bacterium]